MRPPFVVTLGLAGALGCSSSTAAPAGDPTDARLDATDAADAALPPNPGECPPADPGFGPLDRKCAVAETVRCRYVDACPLRPSSAHTTANTYVCHDSGAGGQWTLVDDYNAGCPAAPPSEGDPCPCSPHLQFVLCTYGACESLNKSIAQCQSADALDAVWHVVPQACNPPEADGGRDADAADAGDAADGG